MKKVTIKLENKTMKINKGTSLLELIKTLGIKMPYTIIAAKVNNKVKELTEKIKKNCTVEFLDTSDRDGVRVYRRGLSFVLIAAAKKLYPGCRVNIMHSLSRGVYCEINYKRNLEKEDIEKIENCMKEIVRANLPFIKKRYTKKEAERIFVKEGLPDKVQLLKYRKKDEIYLYSCNGIIDCFYGYMPPGTGYLKHFALKFYAPGFILRYPERGNPNTLPKFTDNKQLANVLIESKRWAQILGVSNTGSLNDAISNGETINLIKIAEALHEKKIANIADMIYKKRDKIKLVLIAGPSSSGKTIFTQRLIVQLQVNGLKPVAISTDNYFLSRKLTPCDENGEYDFESIQAINTKLFNKHLYKLTHGEEVRLSRYDFLKGRCFKGKSLKLSEDHILLVEGIHALNEKLTKNVPRGEKFKIYVSALTQINLDNHNRIHTSDCRLIRRIIRDYYHRGHNAEETLKMWDSVRRGEERNIFPFQEEANMMFNSALVYEMSVLKKYLIPLIKKIKTESPVYPEAVRLLSFINYFKEAPSKDVPSNSILKEFIKNKPEKCS